MTITQSISRGIGRSLSVPINTRIDELRRLIQGLFGSGQQGLIYVPRPTLLGKQALYQDSAGTTPVTADGDPVGLMLDLSGRGNHATQSTSAARPTYRTDGALHRAQADGVDDNLKFPEVAIAGPITISMALKYGNNSGVSMALGYSVKMGTSPKIGQVDGSYFARLVNGGNSISAGSVDTNPHVLTLVRDVDNVVSMRVDGVEVGSSSMPGTVAFDQLCGSYAGGTQSQFFNGDRFGTIIAEGDDRVDEIESYIARLSGVTL